MLQWIFNGLLGLVAGPILDGYKAKLAADGQGQQLGTDIVLKQIDSEIEARRSAREIRLATSGFWEMRLLTFLIAGCFTLHLVLVTADTCFGLGLRVPKFPAPFDEWQGVTLLSFFGVQVAGQGIMAIAAGMMGRRK
jgi:hypothetical protein